MFLKKKVNGTGKNHSKWSMKTVPFTGHKLLLIFSRRSLTIACTLYFEIYLLLNDGHCISTSQAIFTSVTILGYITRFNQSY